MQGGAGGNRVFGGRGRGEEERRDGEAGVWNDMTYVSFCMVCHLGTVAHSPPILFGKKRGGEEKKMDYITTTIMV